MPDPVTAALAIGGIASSAANIFGASSAANAQEQAAAQASAAVLQQQKQGLAAQKGYFDQGNAPLSAIAGKGVNDYANLEAAIPGLTAPITMDQATLEATPGYQFNLSQGERGVALGAAAAGLSGAQAKAAAKYATGLADSTYQNQFANANTNKQNAFNFLLGTANLGTSAAGQYGANATAAGNADVANSQQVGANLSSNTIGAGNAQAAAYNSIGKSVGTGLQAASVLGAGGGNPFGNYGMYGALSGPAYGGGNAFTDAYGGSASNPLAGLNASDYG